MTATRGLRENSALAFAGDGASKIGALVVVVLAARLLPVPEFAALATGLAAAGLISSLLDMGSGTLLTRDGARGRPERGALFGGLLRARLPLAVATLVVAPVVGIALAQPVTALAVAALGTSGALALSVLGLYRSCQDIRPEALQKLAAALLSIVATVLVCVVVPRADLLLATLGAITVATLWPLIRRRHYVAEFGTRVAPMAALRVAAPIGLLALATVAYYRSGMIVLALLADPKETAVFGVASSVAFGMLMLPNAVTTALLPRLAAQSLHRDVVAGARRALIWTFIVATLMSAAAAAVVPVGLPLVLGSKYASAGLPFALLCIGIPLIAASGVIGTSLLSVGRIRPLGVQVAVSLAVNVIVLALLVPSLGAVGAALATVACELAGLVLLLHIARTVLPGLVSIRPSTRPQIQPSGAATT